MIEGRCYTVEKSTGEVCDRNAMQLGDAVRGTFPLPSCAPSSMHLLPHLPPLVVRLQATGRSDGSLHLNNQ